MNEPVVRSAETPFGDEVLESAYHSVIDELEALNPEELAHINLDIFEAVNAVAGVIPELRALRPRIARELPTFDRESFDKLHRYALAAAYAQAAYLLVASARDDLRPLFREAVELRALLLSDVTALVNRGLVRGEPLRNLKGAVGYKNVQLDLLMLVSLLRANWDAVRGKCAVTMPELARGEKLVTRLIELVGHREQGAVEVHKTADMRVRAFTLFTRTYLEARNAVQFLRRREGDADAIAPSLFAGRSNGRLDKGKKAEEAASKAKEETKALQTQAEAPAEPGEAPPIPSGIAVTRMNGPFVAGEGDDLPMGVRHSGTASGQIGTTDRPSSGRQFDSAF